MPGLERWIAREWDHAAEMMLKSISATDVVKERARFGQVIVPKPGSVVASPVLAAYDPEPDYFFHWYRDSALVMDALRLLKSDLPQAEQLFQDFVHFSRALDTLDGRSLPPDWRDAVHPEFRRFLRTDAGQAHGAAIQLIPASILMAAWTSPIGPGPSMTDPRCARFA